MSSEISVDPRHSAFREGKLLGSVNRENPVKYFVGAMMGGGGYVTDKNRKKYIFYKPKCLLVHHDRSRLIECRPLRDQRYQVSSMDYLHRMLWRTKSLRTCQN